MQKVLHDSLQREVEKIFGKKIISYSDCVQLAKEIVQNTGFNLSMNTIRRFFGVVPADYPPSRTTLNILALYAGYRSYDHFEENQRHTSIDGEMGPSMFLDYISLLFHRAAVSTYTDPTWMSIIRETTYYLQRHPAVIDSFQHIAAQTLIGQQIYYEQFVHIDRLNGYYGDGLRYYLAAKVEKEALIFGHSLLALRFFLVENKPMLEMHYQDVMQHTIDVRDHPFICGRYFATQVLYYNDQPERLYRVATEARKFYRNIFPSRDVYQAFPCFELVFTEALILTGQVVEALFYIQESKKKKTDYIPPAVDVQLFAALDLYEAIAYAKTGDEDRAKKAFRRIKPTDFYFLSRRYHTLMYLALEAFLFKTKEAENRIEMGKLVKDTGFLLLQAFLSSETVDKKEQ